MLQNKPAISLTSPHGGPSGTAHPHPAPVVLQRKHAGGLFAHFNPAEVERSDKTNAQATVDGVPLKNPATDQPVFVNDSSAHAEIKIINAFLAKHRGYGPRVLSIRINRIPCKPCAEAIVQLLNDYPQLAVRIKATTITRPGKEGLTLLDQHPRAYIRYWTTGELSAKGLIFKHQVVTDAPGEARNQFKQWAHSLGIASQSIESILNTAGSPKDKATKIKLLFKELVEQEETSDRTVRNYTDGLIRTLYPAYKDQALAPYQGNWNARNLTRVHIVTSLRPVISIADPALMQLRALIWIGRKEEFTARMSEVDFKGKPVLWGGEYRESNTGSIVRINDLEVDGMDPTIWFQLL